MEVLIAADEVIERVCVYSDPYIDSLVFDRLRRKRAQQDLDGHINKRKAMEGFVENERARCPVTFKKHMQGV